jgi:hypothetical protein
MKVKSYGLFPHRRYHIRHVRAFRLGFSRRYRNDVIGSRRRSHRGASAGCNCESNMITIYDVEPGVVTRHWAECVCRYEPNGQRLQHIAAPVGLPDSVPFMDPWRRW